MCVDILVVDDVIYGFLYLQVEVVQWLLFVFYVYLQQICIFVLVYLVVFVGCCLWEVLVQLQWFGWCIVIEIDIYVVGYFVNDYQYQYVGMCGG